MAIFDDKDDKTEPATPKRRGDARNKGTVARSQELSMAVLIVGAVIALQVSGTWIVGALQEALEHGMRLTIPRHGDPLAWFAGELRTMIVIVGPSLLPLLGVLVLLALAAGYGQVGFKVTWQPLAPKFDKLNPANGLRKLLSLRNVMQAALAAGKLTLLAGILYWNLRDELPRLLMLPEIPFAEAAPLVANMMFRVLWWIAVPLLALSLLDVIYQRWQHGRDLRMSKQEIKDEMKQTEGDPEIKSRIKRAQRELARRRMMSEVPKADVVITNPTHFAVALKYERTRNSAPVVTAKGTDRIAQRIRELAQDNDVPIVEDPPLARGLHAGVRLGDEIPPRFYEAVAAVLAHVLRLKGATR